MRRPAGVFSSDSVTTTHGPTAKAVGSMPEKDPLPKYPPLPLAWRRRRELSGYSQLSFPAFRFHSSWQTGQIWRLEFSGLSRSSFCSSPLKMKRWAGAAFLVLAMDLAAFGRPLVLLFYRHQEEIAPLARGFVRGVEVVQ